MKVASELETGILWGRAARLLQSVLLCRAGLELAMNCGA